MSIESKLKSQKGAAVFFFVLVMMITGMVLALNAARLGLGDLEISYALEKNDEVRILAEGCLEDVLNFIRQDHDYGLGEGLITLLFSEGECTISVEDLEDNRRRVISTAKIDDNDKTIYLSITLSDSIILDTWEEIDFSAM